MRIDSKMKMVTIPKMEINEKNELVIDEKEYIIINNDLSTADLVYENGRWV